VVRTSKRRLWMRSMFVVEELGRFAVMWPGQPGRNRSGLQHHRSPRYCAPTPTGRECCRRQLLSTANKALRPGKGWSVGTASTFLSVAVMVFPNDGLSEHSPVSFYPFNRAQFS
jgi:hypothetical protein